MDNKKVVTKDKVFKRAIILCWILLGLCFVIKIFGGNFFNIICNNEKFIKVCEFVDNSIFYWIVSFIFYYIGSMIYVYAVTSTTNFNIKRDVILSILLITSYCTKFISLTVGLIVDIILIEIICTFVICKTYKYKTKETILRVLLGLIFINGFQLLSVFIKGLGIFKVIENNSLIQIIFSIDYYIMLILYYLYSRKIKRR